VPRLRVSDAVIVEEAKKIVEAAENKNVTLRVMGATAIRIHCSKFSHLYEVLKRKLSDIDFMAFKKQEKTLIELLKELNYVMSRDVRLMHRAFFDRYIFQNPANKIFVDVFFDKLDMCHKIEFEDRLNVDYPTISLADLLLEKMQIVRINEKDIKDAIILLREHCIGGNDKETINRDYISDLLSKDWGFHYTTTTNLEKVASFLQKYDALTKEDRMGIKAKIDILLEAIENKPKSLGWRMRAKVGTSKKWYREVETWGVYEY